MAATQAGAGGTEQPARVGWGAPDARASCLPCAPAQRRAKEARTQGAELLGASVPGRSAVWEARRGTAASPRSSRAASSARNSLETGPRPDLPGTGFRQWDCPRQSHGPRLALSSRPGSQPSLPDPPPGDSPPQRHQALGGEGCTGLSHGPWTGCVPVEVRPSDLEDFVPRTSLRGLRVEMTTLRIVGSEHTVGLNVPCSILRLLVQTLANLELHPWLSACHCWVALT